MSQYFINFIHSGNPNTGKHQLGTKWSQAFLQTEHPSLPLPSEWWETRGPPAPDLVFKYIVFGAAGEDGVAMMETVSGQWPHCGIWTDWERMVQARDSHLQHAFWTMAVFVVFAQMLAYALIQGCWKLRPFERSRPVNSGRNPSQNSPGDIQIELVVTDAGEGILKGPEAIYPKTSTVFSLFQQAGLKNVEAVALETFDVEPQGEVTYAVLMQMVHAVTTVLQASSMGDGCNVPVVMNRGIHLVVSILGVLGARAAFVTIAADAPDAWKEKILARVSASLVLVETGVSVPTPVGVSLTMVHLMPDGHLFGKLMASTEQPVDSSPSPDCSSTAMVIFTSGSTGEPKGVIYSQRMLLHGVWFYADLVEMAPGQHALLKSPHIWAVLEYELFPPLITGGRLLVAHPDGHKQPPYLAKMIAARGLHTLMITPRMLDAILDVFDLEYPASRAFNLQHCACVGEALRADVVAKFHQRFCGQAYIHNIYGPSEASCTVWSSPPAKPPDQGYVLAGVPQPHVTLYLMDEEARNGGECRPVLPGKVGEIYLGGVVSSGYIGNPSETAARFVMLPGMEGTFYRTGDLGKLVDGQLQVMGRCDRQLNVAGVRIEPGQVESAIRQCAKESCVLAAGEPERLVAVCVADIGKVEDKEAVQRACSEKMPPYMVPKVIIWVNQLPSLPNGKVDIRAVQALVETALEEEDTVEQVDSLGVKKRLNQAAVQWQAATWKCYAYWSYGVVIDHWMECSPKSLACDVVLFGLPDWAELFVRSIGNVQDLCGFLMIGAINDAELKEPERAKLGRREIVVWIAHILTFAVIPLMNLLTPWQHDYPNVRQANVHRWYLWMYVLARVAIHVFTYCNVPPMLQVALALLGCSMAPKSGILDLCAAVNRESFLHQIAYAAFPSYCETKYASVGSSAVRELDTSGGSEWCTCAVTGKSEIVYIALYLIFFHMSSKIKQAMHGIFGLFIATCLTILLIIWHRHVHRAYLWEGPIILTMLLAIGLIAFMCESFVKIANSGSSCFALLGATIILQFAVGKFLYAELSLEMGTLSLAGTPLEVFTNTLLPMSFFAVMLQISSGQQQGRQHMLTRWIEALMHRVGQSALFIYLMHYYFTPSGVKVVQPGIALIQHIFGPVIAGPLQLIWVLTVPILFMLASCVSQRLLATLFGRVISACRPVIRARFF